MQTRFYKKESDEDGGGERRKKSVEVLFVLLRRRERELTMLTEVLTMFFTWSIFAQLNTSDKKSPDSDVVPFLFSMTVSRSSALFPSFFSSFFIVSRI